MWLGISYLCLGLHLLSLPKLLLSKHVDKALEARLQPDLPNIVTCIAKQPQTENNPIIRVIINRVREVR
jgi:hypothetical protein